MSHCGHIDLTATYAEGEPVDVCCKCLESWWSDGDPPKTECVEGSDVYHV